MGSTALFDFYVIDKMGKWSLSGWGPALESFSQQAKKGMEAFSGRLFCRQVTQLSNLGSPVADRFKDKLLYGRWL